MGSYRSSLPETSASEIPSTSPSDSCTNATKRKPEGWAAGLSFNCTSTSDPVDPFRHGDMINAAALVLTSEDLRLCVIKSHYDVDIGFVTV